MAIKIAITNTSEAMSTPELKKKKVARDAELAKKAKETAAAAEKVKKMIISWLQEMNEQSLQFSHIDVVLIVFTGIQGPQ